MSPDGPGATHVFVSHVTAGGAVNVSVGPTRASFGVPQELPPPLPDFTGREAAVAAVTAALLEGTRRVAVVGPAGAGKSVLAVQVGDRVRGHFPDGQLFVDLRGRMPEDTASELVAGVLRSFGVGDEDMPGDEAGRVAAYRTLLSTRRVLLVVDNVRTAEDVRVLLPSGEGSAVLVTTRNADLSVDGLHRVRIAEMDDEEALALLSSASGRDVPAGEADDAGLVVWCCGGLPLALRISGTLLAARPHWSFAHLARHLHDERQRLDRLAVDDLAVRASLSLSVRELDAELLEAFTLAGAVPGVLFTSPLIAHLREQDHDEAAAALDHLVARQLVEPLDPGVYRFHELVRLFAWELFESSRDEEGRRHVLQRIVDWYASGFDAVAGSVIAVNQDWGTDDPDTVARYRTMLLVFFDIHRFNLPRLLEEATAAGFSGQVARIALAAAELSRRRWTMAHAERLYETGVAAAEVAGDEERAISMTVDRIAARGLQGHHREAIEAGEAVLRQARARGLRRAEAMIVGNLAFEHGELGDFAKAKDLHEESITLYRALGDRAGEASALAGLALLYEGVDDLGTAERYYREATAVAPDDMEPGALGRIVGNLGRIYGMTGRMDEARTVLEEDLRLNRLAGDTAAQATTLRLLCHVDIEAGKTATALGWCSELVEIEAARGDEVASAELLVGIMNECEDPEPHLHRFRALAEQIVELVVRLDHLPPPTPFDAALLAGHLGRHGTMLSLLERCEKLAPSKGSQRLLAEVRLLRGVVHLLARDFPAAVELIDAAEDAWIDIGDLHGQARSAAALLTAYGAVGDRAGASDAAGRFGVAVQAMGPDADAEALLYWFCSEPWFAPLVTR